MNSEGYFGGGAAESSAIIEVDQGLAGKCGEIGPVEAKREFSTAPAPFDDKQLAKLRALLITIGRDRRRPRELRRHAESIITLIDGRGIDPIRSTHFAYTYRLFKWAAAGAPERAMLPPAQIAAAFGLGEQPSDPQ